MEEIITLKNKLGMVVTCYTMGAGLVNIEVPDRNGAFKKILICPTPDSEYIRLPGQYGKPAGRTAGRIAPKIFSLDGKEYEIDKGIEGPFALHGGKECLSMKHFDFKKTIDKKTSSVLFTHLSPDGEGGFPGNLQIKITFTLMNDENRLVIHHEATTDKKTLCNLTNHAYFNLSGGAERKVIDEEMFINAQRVGKVDNHTVAVALNDVDEAFNFQKPHKIGDFIEKEEVQTNTHGYDHPFLLNKQDPKIVQASLYDEKSGRFMEMRTSYEACVCYTCNWPGNFPVQNGKNLAKYDAVCLEMQHFPNTINSTFLKDKKDVLAPGEKYDNFIELTFSVK